MIIGRSFCFNVPEHHVADLEWIMQKSEHIRTKAKSEKVFIKLALENS